MAKAGTYKMAVQWHCVYLAGIVRLLFGVVQETCRLHLTLTKACAEVDGLLGTRWCRTQDEVIRELAKIIAGELQFSLNFTHLQWLIFKVETTLLEKTKTKKKAVLSEKKAINPFSSTSNSALKHSLYHLWERRSW